MSGKLSISGDDGDRKLFGKTPAGGHETLFRSSAGSPSVRALTATNAQVYRIAVVTREGNRDLFFAARDLDELPSAIKKAKTSIDTFKLQIAPVEGRQAFLQSLTFASQQEQTALEEGRVHQMPPRSGGGFLGKLFGP